MEKRPVKEMARAHLETLEPECRWCFAVDLKRVQGKVIARYDFPDAMVLHLCCPRCGGEFSQYVEVWEGDYLRNRMSKLHPNMKKRVGGARFNEILDLVFPEYLELEETTKSSRGQGSQKGR